jgi:hypothetical protein
MGPIEPCAAPQQISSGESAGELHRNQMFCREIAYAQLAGVGGFWLASYADRRALMHDSWLWAITANIGCLWGLATFVICPLLAFLLLVAGRPNFRDSMLLLILSGLFGALQVLAFLPLIQ